MNLLLRLLHNRWFTGLLLFLPALVFAWLMARYAVNVPYQDAYDGLVGPVAALSEKPGFWESLQILYVQDDERRVIFNRLLAYFVYLLRGEHDHRLQIYLGCLTLAGFWLLFFFTLRRLRTPLWMAVPISLILFQPQYYEGVFWSMLPGQYFAVFFFSFWTVYLVSIPRRWALAGAVITALLAIASDSNGSFSWVVGLLILVYQQRFRTLAVWVLAVLPALFLYYYKLEIPAYRPKISDNLLQLPDVVITDFLAFQGIFADPGPAFPLRWRIALTVLVGLPMLAGIVYWLLGLLSRFPVWNWPQWLKMPAERYRQMPHPVLFLTGAAVVLLITMLAFSVARAGDGVEDLFISRYKLIAALVLLLLYGLLLTAFSGEKQQRIALTFVGIGLIFNLYNYFTYTSELINFRRTLLIDAYSWPNTRTLPSSPIYLTMKDNVDGYILSGLRTKTYRFPSAFYDNLKSMARRDTAATLSVQAQLLDNQQYLMVSDTTFRRGPGIDDGAYIVLHSDSLDYLFHTVQSRSSLSRFVRSGRYFQPGYQSPPILIRSLQPGEYRIGALVVRENERMVQYSSWRLRKDASGISLRH